MKIVFVHGRSQQKKNSVELKEDWTSALESGLKNIGQTLNAKHQIAFPYYGDLLFQASESASRDSFENLLNKGADAASPTSTQEQEFIGEIILEMAHQNGISNHQIAQEAGIFVEKGALNWPAILAALRLLNKVPRVASASIELITRDVWCYLTNRGARFAVNDVVHSEIPQDEPCIVVAHSLGTVVAYNVLMNRPNRSNVRLFLTLGSPLGIEAIFSRLPSDIKPRKSPSGVADWFNARDPHDTVALFEIGADLYLGSPIVKNFSGVVNTSENRHGIVEYLCDGEVASVLAKHL